MERTRGRVRGGIEAKAYGQLFERIFQKTCRLCGAAVTRIPDGCRRVTAQRLVPVRSPFDWIVTLRGRTALIDTKTTQGDVLTASSLVSHQIQELSNHERSGAITGYVVWFRNLHRTVFYPAAILLTLLDSGGSIPADHPGSIDLGSETFNIRRLFE